METVDIIIQFVNGCGFPIVAFFALFYMILRDRNSREEERAAWKKSIDANTDMLYQLHDAIVNVLGGEENVND